MMNDESLEFALCTPFYYFQHLSDYNENQFPKNAEKAHKNCIYHTYTICACAPMSINIHYVL